MDYSIDKTALKEFADTADRQHICAELARAIWPGAEMRPEYEGDGILYMINPTPTTSGTGWQCFNPFTDAAASRALVEWIAADDKTWIRFASVLHEYCRNTVNEEWRVYVNRSNKEISGMDMMQRFERAIMTAPLETIALAAARALGIISDASNAPEGHDDHAPGCPCAWCRVKRDNAAMGKKNEAAPNTA